MNNSVYELANRAKEAGVSISEIAIEIESESTLMVRDVILRDMEENCNVMLHAVSAGLYNRALSDSKLSGGDAVRVIESENLIFKKDPIMQKLLAYALAVSEQNAKMGIVVACPTAGSCGILPAVLAVLRYEFDIELEELIKSMCGAGAIGAIVAENASIAGAYGGCQAECGTATAMAAALAVEALGGDPDMVCNAVALAFKSLMGLVCDPVGGLVEVPCVKRNAFCAVTAFSSASMALAGVASKIPVDEVILAMDEVGKKMHPDLKETAKGGIAITKTAKELSNAWK